MSDTKTVREPCDHGRYDKHMWSGPKTIETNQHQPMDWCRGGKEIVLRQRFFPNGQWMYATERMGEPKQHIPLLEVEVVEE